jgi:hypothetical protein
MHPPHVRAAALALIEQGLNDCEVSRRLGIPRRTILDWRRPTYVPRKPSSPQGDVPSLLASCQADSLHSRGLLRASWPLPRRRLPLRARTGGPAPDYARPQVPGHHSRGAGAGSALHASESRRHRPQGHHGLVRQRVLLLGALAVRSAAARPQEEARATDCPGALAIGPVRTSPVGILAWLYPFRRLVFHQPHRAVRVSELRLLKPVGRHSPSVRPRLRASGRGVSTYWRSPREALGCTH